VSSVPIPPDQVGGYFVVDRVAVAARMREQNIATVGALARRMNVKAITAKRVLDGHQIQASTLAKLCKALGIDDVRTLLAADSPFASAIDETRQSVATGVGEWLAAGRPSRWVTAANGLQYRTVPLVNRHLPQKRAVGKQYELEALSDRVREWSAEALRRHPEVCCRLESSPRFPVNLTTLPSADGSHWWVIDQWIEGDRHVERLLDGPLPEDELATLGREVLIGIAELHEQQVLYRELSPASVLLPERGGVLLTDFELGKLLDGAPTVSRDWEGQNPYRAPEVAAPDSDGRVDLYSWGRLVTHAAVGECPAVGAEAIALKRVELPERVRRLVLKCVAVAPSKRPTSAAAALKKLGDWGVPR